MLNRFALVAFVSTFLAILITGGIVLRPRSASIEPIASTIEQSIDAREDGNESFGHKLFRLEGPIVFAHEGFLGAQIGPFDEDKTLIAIGDLDLDVMTLPEGVVLYDWYGLERLLVMPASPSSNEEESGQ